jgi:hypothetical protein
LANSLRGYRTRIRTIFIRLLRLGAGVVLLGVIAIVYFRVHCASIPLLFSPTTSAVHNPAQAAGLANYSRPEVDTFYTYPEWYIVWSYQSKADFQQGHLPSGYSYFGDIAQFWQAYCRMYSVTRAIYPFPAGDHIMLAVIGSSFSVEYALKGLYEKTVGRLSEWTSRHEPVAEDFYAAQVAENYAAFVHIRPFYEFSFAHALHGLWGETPFRTTHLLRTLERRAWLTLDYSVEALYCQIIELGTHATYGFEDTTTKAWVDFPPEVNSASLGGHFKIVRDLGGGAAMIEVPRYQEFTPTAQMLIQAGAHFRQIAGNQLIVVSAIAPSQWTNNAPDLQVLLVQPLLTNSGKTRVVLLIPVPELNTALPRLEADGLVIEHLYDY